MYTELCITVNVTVEEMMTTERPRIYDQISLTQYAPTINQEENTEITNSIRHLPIKENEVSRQLTIN